MNRHYKSCRKWHMLLTRLSAEAMLNLPATEREIGTMTSRIGDIQRTLARIARRAVRR